MPDRYELATMLFTALTIGCAIALLTLVIWDRQPRKEPQRPTVPQSQRLPPAE
jgi:hypothetical protein